MGTSGLEGLAEVLKLMSKVGALQKKAKRQEAAKAGRMPGRKSWPNSEETKQLRADLDDVGLAFRVYGSKAQPPDGWMRAVRQAIGVPVVELARRMGVKKSQIFRLEESERDGRVRMATLRRAAEAMGCELVYALVPREGKLASNGSDAARRGRSQTGRESVGQRPAAGAVSPACCGKRRDDSGGVRAAGHCR